jgi:hypothetical protein
LKLLGKLPNKPNTVIFEKATVSTAITPSEMVTGINPVRTMPTVKGHVRHVATRIQQIGANIDGRLLLTRISVFMKILKTG